MTPVKVPFDAITIGRHYLKSDKWVIKTCKASWSKKESYIWKVKLSDIVYNSYIDVLVDSIIMCKRCNVPYFENVSQNSKINKYQMYVLKTNYIAPAKYITPKGDKNGISRASA